MLFQTQSLVFFSLNCNTTNAFERYVKYTGKEYIENSLFQLIREEDGKAKRFRHFQELLYFLPTLELPELANLILIVDYYSFEKGDDKQLLYELIVQYPEVKLVFMGFDKPDWFNDLPKHELQCIENKKCKKYVDCNEPEPIIITPFFHSFNFFDSRAFDLLIRGKSNLFDASNLRNCIKQHFYYRIKVRSNYPCLQCSRIKNLSMTVDEEFNQAYISAYSLYSLGYRVIPVISCSDLSVISNDKEITNKIKLIVRDYDLQFEDYDDKSKNCLSEIIITDKEVELLDVLRGLKYYKDNKKWIILDELWGRFSESEIWFLSRLSSEDKIDREPELKKKIRADNRNGIDNKNKNKKPVIRGITKPLDGLWHLSMVISDVNDVYDHSVDGSEITSERTDDPSNQSHSVSPFIFHIAENLIRRSQAYYDKRMYMLSAVLANEAVEILNGFHMMMALKAIYLQAIAEAKLETEFLGIDENMLSKSVIMRFDDIKSHVERLCHSNPKAMKNVLSQIFNDTRHILKEKEQFSAAEMALIEFVEQNHGMDILILFKKFQKLCQKIITFLK